jgi:cell division protein FtsN
MRKNKNKTKLIAVVGISALLVTGAAIGLYQKFGNNTASVDTTTADSESKIDLSPPTEEEKQQAEDNKRRLEQEAREQSQSNNNNTKPAKPVITSAGQYDSAQYGTTIEVRTLVTGVYETGGECTATFTMGSQKLERRVEALQDATTTRCDAVIIPRADFPAAGTWDLVVSYSSAAYKGVSDPAKVEVK